MSDEHRYENVHRQLRDRGLATDDDWWPLVGPLESGHYVHYGLDQGKERWHLEIRHNGDPTGSFIRSDVGPDDDRVAERMMDELRHRDVVKAMGDQWRRATQAGDPQGLTDPRYPAEGHEYPQHPSHVFRHYE